MTEKYISFHSTSEVLTSLKLWSEEQNCNQINLGQYVLSPLCFFPKFGYDLSNFVLIKDSITEKIGLAIVIGISDKQIKEIFRNVSSRTYMYDIEDLQNINYRIICNPIYDDIDILFSKDNYSIITKQNSLQGIWFLDNTFSEVKSLWFNNIEYDYRMIICNGNSTNYVFNIAGEQLYKGKFEKLSFISTPLPHYDFIFNYGIYKGHNFLLGVDSQNKYIIDIVEDNHSKDVMSDNLLYIGRDCFLRRINNQADIINKEGDELCEPIKGSFIFLLDGNHYLSRQESNYNIFDFNGNPVSGPFIKIHKVTNSLILAESENEYHLLRTNGEMIITSKDFMIVTREFWKLSTPNATTVAAMKEAEDESTLTTINMDSLESFLRSLGVKP